MNKYQIKSNLLTFVIAFDVLFKNQSLSQEEKKQQANLIFEQLRNEGLTPNIRIFIILMRYALDFEDALTIYDKMVSLNIKPNHKLFETMTTVCLTHGKANDGINLTSLLRIFDLMIEEGIKPHISLLNNILKHCNKPSEKKIAAYIIELIHNLKITPDDDTIVMQMRIFPQHSEETFHQARRNGNLESKTLAYNTVIDNLVNPKSLDSRENIKKVKKYIKLMKKDAISFDIKTFATMISYYYIIGDHDQIAPLAQEIERRGLPYTFISLKKLLEVHAMLQNFEMVEFYFQKINTMFKPDIDTYCILLKLYTITKRYMAGIAIIDRIIQAQIRNTRVGPKKIVRTFLTESQSTLNSILNQKVPFHEIVQSCRDLGLL